MFLMDFPPASVWMTIAKQ